MENQKPKLSVTEILREYNYSFGAINKTEKIFDFKVDSNEIHTCKLVIPAASECSYIAKLDLPTKLMARPKGKLVNEEDSFEVIPPTFVTNSASKSIEENTNIKESTTIDNTFNQTPYSEEYSEYGEI